MPQGNTAPPNSFEAEQALLCCVLNKPERLEDISESVSPDDFYTLQHRTIFSAMLTLTQRGVDCSSLLVLMDYLKSIDKLKEVGGMAYISQVFDALPGGYAYKDYLRIVREKATLRALYNETLSIQQRCYDDHERLRDFLSEVEQKVFAIGDTRVPRKIAQVGEASGGVLQDMLALADSKLLVTGLSTGMLDLDRMTRGLQPSDLVVIAGRPGCGKTAYACQLALTVAQDTGAASLIFSLEMSKDQLIRRWLCTEAKINIAKIATIGQQDRIRLQAAEAALAKLPLYIEDSVTTTAAGILAAARRYKREKNIRLVVVDYLQLLTPPSNDQKSRRREQNRAQEVSEMSRQMKTLAKELDVTVLLISQLNRQVEQRTDKRPMMSDLRESSSIEADADVIFFLYRDEMYNQESPARGICEIIIGKQRNGPTGIVKVAFFPEYARFDNLVSEEMYGGNGNGVASAPVQASVLPRQQQQATFAEFSMPPDLPEFIDDVEMDTEGE